VVPVVVGVDDAVDVADEVAVVVTVVMPIAPHAQHAVPAWKPSFLYETNVSNAGHPLACAPSAQKLLSS